MNELRFEYGRFIEIAGVIEDGKSGILDWLHTNGFFRSQTFGNDCGVHFTLWEHPEHTCWCIVFWTAEQSQLIHTSGWVNLLGLLAILSPIALAGAMHEGPHGSAVFDVNVIPPS